MPLCPLVASVVHSKLLYADPVWANALQNHVIQRKLFSAQRRVALRIVSAYRTVPTSAVLVLASVPPIDLLASARMEGADSSRNGRWDGMVSRQGDGHTAWSRSLPPGWTESMGKSAFIWRKRSRAMAVLTRT